MDDLDTLLLESWHEVSAKLKQQPWALARRMERVSRKELRRPVRAWCVALRASDTRLGAHEMRDEMAARCCYKGYTHSLMLRSRRLRELCKPVRIDWPGVPIVEAARLLGRDERTVWSWSKKGVLDSRRDGAVGRRGQLKRCVWSDKAIDPQADDGRGPWAVWGTLWQGLSGRVPIDFEQAVERTPRLRRSAEETQTANVAWPGRYRGWDWLCPGRVLACGTRVPCGRVCKKLWLPLPAWTIGDALGDRAGTSWESMPRFALEGKGLACSRCWGLRFDNHASDPAEAWNRFVSVVSGGLLYGREVERRVLWEGASR